ncbi:unnamed protein product [Schistocephalus solidus]|uniref:Transcription initiation factor TFIID subunit 13 n=1 Tax=Schistocephalus solidus TaxID=70667 RepID=A0A183T120_SCHSO|nr:unnamed protein product [Schistocephalus solidus]
MHAIWFDFLLSFLVRSMLYAFGDVESPLPETVAVLEEIAVQYIIDMSRRALETGRVGKITVEDIAYLVRKESRKFSRAKELLLVSEELKRARKAFKDDEFNIAR